LARIKALGYAVKLDTNGSRPEVLRQLVTAGLVDYVVTDGTAVLGLGDIGRIHFIDWD
jgi:pyruvate formate lyase activating enzyme